MPVPSVLSWINPHTLLSVLPEFIVPKREHDRKKQALAYLEKGSAYYKIQNETPRTAAYGLNDSPIGLLGWIAHMVSFFFLFPVVCRSVRPGTSRAPFSRSTQMIPSINHAVTQANPT